MERECDTFCNPMNQKEQQCEMPYQSIWYYGVDAHKYIGFSCLFVPLFMMFVSSQNLQLTTHSSQKVFLTFFQ